MTEGRSEFSLIVFDLRPLRLYFKWKLDGLMWFRVESGRIRVGVGDNLCLSLGRYQMKCAGDALGKTNFIWQFVFP